MALVGQSLPHDSAREHVTGEAVFIDDLPAFQNELRVGFVGSPVAHGIIRRIDISKAGQIDGVAAVLTHTDVPGSNAFGPIFHDEEVLAEAVCHYVGQPIVAIAADSKAALEAAAKAVEIEVEPLPPILTIEEAMARRQFIGSTRHIRRGDVAAAWPVRSMCSKARSRAAARSISTSSRRPHSPFPARPAAMTVHSSTQNPTEIQALVAPTLGLGNHQVVCVCRRMGGGFGGKETQAAQVALLAALVAFKTRRPARFVSPAIRTWRPPASAILIFPTIASDSTPTALLLV